MNNRVLIAVLLGALLAGCTTMDPYTREEKTSNATKGAAIGAAAGAVIGAIANDGKGAVAGAAVGAAAGGGIGYYMDRQEMKLRQELEGTGVSVTRDGNTIRLNMPSNITFGTDRSDIRPDFQPVLDSVVKVAKEFDDTALRISGHTDSTGSDSYNQRLSELRALTVKDYLTMRGVDPNRLTAIGYGENYPIADNGTEAGRAMNRRVEVEMIPMQQAR
ncbi:MAG: OmpA family protein [Gammaproteobacteria bacterium]|nr:OmpA family protein [Gammaproteobacteria bacterium]